jgi:hypothetical protein
MKLFKKIFQKKIDAQQEIGKIPDATLFLESEPPEEKNGHELPSEVTAFLNENHFSAGLSAGYQLHCHDGLLFHLIDMRTRFRRCADYQIVDLQNQIFDKEMIGIQLGDLLPSQKHCLELSLDRNRQQIEEVKKQKELSVDDEGWISGAVSSFKLGFQKGMIDYFNEKEFFKSL